MKLCNCKNWGDCPVALVKSDAAMRLCQTDPHTRKKFQSTINKGISTERSHGEKPGAVLSSRIKWFTGIKGTSECGCSNLASQMNKKGCDWCDKNLDTIVNKMMENKLLLADELNISETILNSSVGDFICRVAARKLVKSSIAKAREQAAERKLKSKLDRLSLPSKSMLSKAKESPTESQNLLYRKALVGNNRIAKPFNGDPIINLVWHIWPVKNSWEWHADRLNELIKLVNGQIIIGIAIDDTTDGYEYVKSKFKDIDRIKFLELKNRTIEMGGEIGELSTVIPAFKMLNTDIDSITIYGHSKGVRSHTKDSVAVRVWTECMYETVSFNIRETIAKMEEGYDMVGSFRTFGFAPLKPKYKWHYSGTFYNFRTQALLKDKDSDFKLKYGGTESWPGDHVDMSKSYCVFRDNSPLMFQYVNDWVAQTIAAQLHWESARFGQGPKMEQHVREFDWLVDQLYDIKSILIIGSRHGGMEYHLRNRLPNLSNIVSIDYEPLQIADELIKGDSHDPAIQKIARDRGPYDAVFIDGDHTEEGARLDWEFALTLNPSKIFFHDFTDAIYHQLTGCHVDKVMPEVLNMAKENDWKISSKVVGCGWGGILQVDMT